MPEGHFTFLPLTENWNAAGTKVTISHADFKYETEYQASVTANDLAGNSMTAPFSWSFETRKALVYLPLVTK